MMVDEYKFGHADAAPRRSISNRSASARRLRLETSASWPPPLRRSTVFSQKSPLGSRSSKNSATMTRRHELGKSSGDRLRSEDSFQIIDLGDRSQ